MLGRVETAPGMLLKLSPVEMWACVAVEVKAWVDAMQLTFGCVWLGSADALRKDNTQLQAVNHQLKHRHLSLGPPSTTCKETLVSKTEGKNNLGGIRLKSSEEQSTTGSCIFNADSFASQSSRPYLESSGNQTITVRNTMVGIFKTLKYSYFFLSSLGLQKWPLFPS